MALANTTLAAAATATDKQFTVASATSLTAGLYGAVDGEVFQISKAYVVGSVTVPVLRAIEGTAQVAHVTGAQISFYVLASDVPLVGPQLSTYAPLAGRGRYPSSVTTSGAWTPRADNQDEYVEINGTSVVAITIVSPLRSQSGKLVTFVGNGIAAHTITYTTTGFGNVGTTADVVTFGANQMQSLQMIASGGFWVLVGPAATATANVSGPAIA
jgi:hypothetical protein